MTMTDTATVTPANEARHAMIVSQLRTSGVNEPWVLAAMAGVARENYVPDEMKNAAYIDRAIPLGNGRFLAAPLFHGKMLSEAEPDGDDKVLLVGDADGYLAALVRPLVGALDVISPTEAVQGSAGGSDYSLLLIDGAIETLPEPLAARLAEGGRLVSGEVLRGVTRLAVARKAAGQVVLMPVAEMGVPVLPEFAAPKRWSF